MWHITSLQRAWQLAARLHHRQPYGHHADYTAHLGAVVFEVLNALQHEPGLDPELALSCAVLHDTVEDTAYTLPELRADFGPAVADGVAALTKDASLPTKTARMADSLRRIRAQPPAVWAVKLADRIVNLQEPPADWPADKRVAYLEEARVIHRALAGGSPYLAGRLAEKIEAYTTYLS